MPLTVLGISVAAAFLVWAALGMFAQNEWGETAGIAGAIGMSVMAGIMLVVAAFVSIVSGWVVCKIFGEDYGGAGSLLTRFNAVSNLIFWVMVGFFMMSLATAVA